MNRREFFKLAGLGAGSLLVAPKLMGSAWTAQWQAEDAVRLAVAHALSQGASYADARIGTCAIAGQHRDFAEVDLLQDELLGMRICTAQGWRKVVMRPGDQQSMQRQISEAMAAPLAPEERNYWIAASFEKERLLAQHTSDSTLEPQVNHAFIRYAAPQALPAASAQLQFCDLITLS